MNVSSHVIRVAPENLEQALESLRRSGLCDVFFHDPQGTIVVTIEGKDVGEEMDKMKAIQSFPFVLSAALAYAYSETELNEAIDKIAQAGSSVPEALKER